MGRTPHSEKDQQWKREREAAAVASRMIATDTTSLATRNWHRAETRETRLFWERVVRLITDAADAGCLVAGRRRRRQRQ